MAPSLTETAVETITNGTANLTLQVNKKAPEAKQDDGPKYPFYYPHYDLNEKFPPTELFEAADPGLRADKNKPNLLANATVTDLNHYIGTEIKGVQISQLNEAGLDELALYAAERKLLIFRDQDFKDIGAERQIAIARRYGPIQRHPTSGNVAGYPEFHVVYRDAAHDRFREYFTDDRVSRIAWHSDVTYEKQPPSTTFFFILEQPDIGGDTLFASQVEAYNRLSEPFKKILHGLKAVHSAVEQAEFSAKKGGPVRRAPVESEHPLVRVHPLTGEKALFVNQGFTRRIVGFKQEESENLLRFLFDHIAKGVDFQIRAKYEPGTVVVWDNRVTVHSATIDFESLERRHAVRLTPQAERPIPVSEN